MIPRILYDYYMISKILYDSHDTIWFLDTYDFYDSIWFYMIPRILYDSLIFYDS